MIPYGRQDIDETDIAAVVATLRSDFLTQGPALPDFEASLRASTGAEHCIVMNSATSALHAACLALGAGPKSRVWTSPISFVASANCALYCGAVVDFVDIDADTFNMSVAALSDKLASARHAGTLPDIVIPVHMAGRSCDMQAIAELARIYGFKIIEDASHAIGGAYRGTAVGGCRFSEITVFSFHPVKIVTTGEGGAALTNDPDLAEAMIKLRSHGITRAPELLVRQDEGPWAYEQQLLGFNYRMTDIQAALGTSQMARLPMFIDRRRRLAERYDALLADLPLVLPGRDENADSSWHLYIVRVGTDPARRRKIFDALRAAGIGVNVHYMPIYRQPFYEALGFASGYCPQAEQYYAGAISIPMFATLTDQDQDRVVAALERAMAP